MLLLDTNALVWWTAANKRLGRHAKARIERSWPSEVRLCVASWYELAALQDSPTVKLRLTVDRMRAELLRAGLVEVDVTGGIALDAAGLRGCPDDPFDRLIMSAARVSRATLVTSDETILDWRGELNRLDARA